MKKIARQLVFGSRILVRKNASSTAGFSLVELLVVLAIIGLIVGLAAPQVLRYLGTARIDTAKTQIRNIENALELYFLDNNGYPSNEEGLGALSKAPAGAASWNGPYLKNADALSDPWQKPYIYKLEGASVRIVSLGRDGKEGGDGEDQDISN